MPLSVETPYDAGPRLLRDVWALTAIAIVIMGLRIVAKLRIKKFGWDDVLMIAALFVSIAGSAMVTLAVEHGFGRHVWDINERMVPKVIMYDYVAQSVGLSGGTIGRIAFIVFIIGLLGIMRSHRIILWVLVCLQVIVNMMFILIIFLQCPGHASAIWQHPGQARCWDLHVQAYYGYFQGSFNSATDLYLAVFATYMFWNLKLKLHIKLGIIILLSLGILAMTASIIKTVQTHILARVDHDPTTATVNLDRWLYIETYLVIITASIPCIRSLTRSMKKHSHLAGGDTHELSSRYAGHGRPVFRARRPEVLVGLERVQNDSEAPSSDDSIFEGVYRGRTHQSKITKGVRISVYSGTAETL